MRRAATLVLALAACHRGDAGPPLDEQWKKVVALARPTVAAADATLLEQAMSAVEPHRDELRRSLDEARATGQPPTLAPEDAGAVDGLVAWYDARGGLPHRTCADLAQGGRRILAAVTLADLALATAPPDAAEKRAEAVLYLGHRLREEGVNLLDISAGSEIADLAIRWATEKHVTPTPAWKQLAPGPGLLPRAIAAEGQCMIELARRPSDTRLHPAELDGLRRFYLAVLADVDRGGSDDDLVARLSERTEEAHGDRAHPTLAVLVPALGRHADRLLEQRRRYHAFVRSIR